MPHHDSTSSLGPAAAPADTLVVGDAFGSILSRCWESGLQPGAALEIIERDDGHIIAADSRHWFGQKHEWSSVERWGYQHATGDVLDVGCGPGRHALALTRDGFHVLGIDTSPGAVRIAQSRGVPAQIGAVSDLLALRAAFDTVLLLGNNLGLLGDKANGQVILDQLASITRPGAHLIGSGIDATATANPDHLTYQESNRRQGKLAGVVRVRVRDGRLSTPWFEYAFHTLTDLHAITASSAWTWTEVKNTNASYCIILTRK